MARCFFSKQHSSEVFAPPRRLWRSRPSLLWKLTRQRCILDYHSSWNTSLSAPPAAMNVPTNAQANAVYPVTHTVALKIARDDEGVMRVIPTTRSLQQCEVCSKPTTNRCSACHRTAYCSTEHQAENWLEHRGKVCRAIYRKHMHYLSSIQNALDQINVKPSPRVNDQIVEFTYVFSA